MKSSSYYYRKADALRECGHWVMADEMRKYAQKAARIEKRRKARGEKK